MSDKIYAQFEIVRRTGLANMYDVIVVRSIARELGFSELEDACSRLQSYSEILKGYGAAGVGELQEEELESLA